MAPVINGFSCSNDRAAIGVKTFTVPGTGVLPDRRPVRIALRADVAPLLLELLRFWHTSIEPIDVPPIDDWGYAARAVRGSTSPSFHWAAIGSDANALRHPLGKRGTLSPDQVRRLTAKADTLGIRLGANYRTRVDTMHAEVIVSRPRALALVRALQSPAGSPPPAVVAPQDGRPTLRLGSRGISVHVAQDTLARKGFLTDRPDKIFGLRTQAAVRAFQRSVGITADGVIGGTTWRALLTAVVPPPSPSRSRWPTVRRGSTGAAVGVFQRFVGLVADNDFGPKTEAAVRRYQQMRGLEVDGAVGPATWAATGL